MHVAAYNLALVMRLLLGAGTPRLAARGGLLLWLLDPATGARPHFLNGLLARPERWVAWVRELKPLAVLVENIPARSARSRRWRRRNEMRPAAATAEKLVPGPI